MNAACSCAPDLLGSDNDNLNQDDDDFIHENDSLSYDGNDFNHDNYGDSCILW